MIQVIPPKGWVPQLHGYDEIDLMIPKPIYQMIEGSKGVYKLHCTEQKALSVKEFEHLANSDKYVYVEHGMLVNLCNTNNYMTTHTVH